MLNARNVLAFAIASILALSLAGSAYGGTLVWEFTTDVGILTDAPPLIQRESHIAASPTSQSTLVVAAIEEQSGAGTDRCVRARSTTTGATWITTGKLLSIAGTNLTATADPVVVADTQGAFYVACVGRMTPGNLLGLGYWKSTNGGDTFGTFQFVNARSDSDQDKPWMARAGTSVYMCWTRIFAASSAIVFKRAAPTLGPEVTLATAGASDSDLVQGCYIATGPSGQIYVVWIRYSGSTSTASLRMRRSHDGGSSFLSETTVVSSLTRIIPASGCAGLSPHGCLIGESGVKFRTDSFPRMAVDLNGVVHVVYARNSTSFGAQIDYTPSSNCRTSSDPCTFSSPLPINTDSTNRDQWEPAIAVRGNPSTVHVTALDRRDDPGNVKWRAWHYHCHWSSLCDSAFDWANTRVSTRDSTNDSFNFIGDYDGVTGDSLRQAVAAWTDSVDEGDLDIWGDRTTT